MRTNEMLYSNETFRKLANKKRTNRKARRKFKEESQSMEGKLEAREDRNIWAHRKSTFLLAIKGRFSHS